MAAKYGSAGAKVSQFGKELEHPVMNNPWFVENNPWIEKKVSKARRYNKLEFDVDENAPAGMRIRGLPEIPRKVEIPMEEREARLRKEQSALAGYSDAAYRDVEAGRWPERNVGRAEAVQRDQARTRKGYEYKFFGGRRYAGDPIRGDR
jgi:hypothetical protein